MPVRFLISTGKTAVLPVDLPDAARSGTNRKAIRSIRAVFRSFAYLFLFFLAEQHVSRADGKHHARRAGGDHGTLAAFLFFRLIRIVGSVAAVIIIVIVLSVVHGSGVAKRFHFLRGKRAVEDFQIIERAFAAAFHRFVFVIAAYVEAAVRFAERTVVERAERIFSPAATLSSILSVRSPSTYTETYAASIAPSLSYVFWNTTV